MRLLFLVCFLLFSTAAALGQSTTTAIWTVADRQTDCGKTLCFLVREGESGEWKILDGRIEGFRFRAGLTQTIRVEIVPLPGGASRYRSRAVVKREKTDGRTADAALAAIEAAANPILAERNWILVAIEGKPVDGRSDVLRFDGAAQRFGIRICNRIGGRFQQAGRSLKFENVVSTKLGCPPALAELEGRFSNAVGRVTAARTDGGKLLLLAGSDAVLELTERLSLEGTRWAIATVGGKKVVTSGDVPYLQLNKENGALSGFAGCNQVFGKYVLNGAALKFSELTTTKMACTEAAIGPFESGILEALEKADSQRIANGTLEILGGGRVLMTLNAAVN